MIKIKLKDVVKYSQSRGNFKELTIDTYISTDNLLQDKIGLKLAVGLPPSGNSFSKYKKGDILISNIRPYLKKIWYANRDGLCSSDVLVFTANQNFDSKFVYYNLHSDHFFEHMMKGAKGTKMPRGDKNQILEFDIPNFPLPSQQKISTLLSALDKKIELNNKISADLGSIAKTLYDYWFVQFDFPDKNGKPYKNSGGNMVYNVNLNKAIPMGWKVQSLFDIADFVNGLACQNYRKVNETDDFLLVIKIKEMNDGISANTERVRVDIPSKYIVEDGDVLFSWSATLDVKIWSEGQGALNQHIFKVTSKLFPKSFYYFEILNYLQHFKMMAELRKTTMGHITKDHLIGSRIAVPPRPLIKQLDQKLSPILEKILLNHKQNQYLSNLRDWLLPILLNGNVRVNKISNQDLEGLGVPAELNIYNNQEARLNIRKNDMGFAKQVLAGKIVSIFKMDKHFTHIKFQKLQFLAEHIAEADLNLNYYFQSAGPYDNRFMHTIADAFRKSKWFDERKYKFIPLDKHNEINTYYEKYFKPVSNQLSRLFELLTYTTEAEIEIIATVYAVWNNRIRLKQPVIVSLLIEDFYNWSDRKHQYTRKQILDAIKWLTKNKFIPTGFGKEIKRAKTK